MLITFSDMECVLKDGVHDPTDAKGGLDYIGNNFLHCGRKTQTESVCYRIQLQTISLIYGVSESHHAESSGTASH